MAYNTMGLTASQPICQKDWERGSPLRRVFSSISFGVFLLFAGAASASAQTASISGPAEIQEGRTATFEVSLSSAAHSGAAVGYSISGTAVAGMDYSGSVSGNLTFATGEQMKTLEVATTLDTVADDGDTLVVTLIGSGTASVDSSSGTATTAIRDLQLTVAPSHSQYVIEGKAVVHNLRANYPALKDYTFSVAVTDGTATGGSAPGSGVDFDDSATELVLRAGETGTVLRTDTFKDSIDEPLENFTVSISHAEQLFDSQNSDTYSHQLKILDQNPTGISISADMVAIAENGGRASITVSLSRLLGDGDQEFRVYLDFAGGITGIGRDFTLEPPSSPPANVSFVNFGTTDPVGNPPYVSFRSGTTVRSTTFTLATINDKFDEGDHETVLIRVGLDSGHATNFGKQLFGGWETETGKGRVQLKITDDDIAARTQRLIRITELGGNTEMAEGDSDSYDVVLMALPDGDVTITTEVRNRDPNTEGDVITLSPASLTFTPGNWNQPQTVTVNAVDDTGFTSRLDAHKATIRHSASGGGYDRVGIRDVEVTVWDRDEFGVRFSETDGATVVSEDNLSDSYTVVLKGWNLDDDNVAVISIVSSDATAVAVEPSVLRFTKDDYNKPQTVTVRGVSDAVDQGNGRRHATLRHSIANYHTSAGRYTQDTKPVLLRDIQVAVLERGYNVPAVSITPVDPVAVEGTAASFALRATPNPASPITVDLQVVEGMGSDFVLPADEGPKQVTIGTNGMATLTVNTVAEATDKPDGMVTVSVLAGDDHSVKSPGLATVRIKDDEATTVTFDPSWGSGVSSSTNQGVTVKEFHENPPPPALRLTVRLSRSLVDGEWVRVPLLFPDAVAYGVKVSLDLMRPIPGVSFDPDTSTLEFVGPSDGSADIRVTPVHDWDNEDERVEFGMPQSMESSLGGGVDGGRSIVLYIEDIDGDSQESVEINADEISLKEGKEETYRVHLNGPPYSTVTVTAKVSDPSRAQVKINSTSADKSTDFGSQRSLTISSNDWSTITSIHSITVKALNDNVLGDPAVIEIEHAISGPNFEAKGRANKIVRVYIEEVGKPAASISGPEEVQEGRTVPFEVSLSSAAHQGVEVGYSISGTAVAGMDYSGSVSGNLTFAAGEQMKTLEVPTTLDTVADDGETLVVTLTGSTNASVDSSSGTATTAIRDLQLTVAPSQNQFVLEGDTIVYNLRANYPALKDYTFSVAVTDGTATGGSAPGSGVDFDDSATELVLRAGETGTVLRTDTFKDSVDEPLENFTVSISHAEQLFEPQTFMEFTQTPREFTQMLSILDQDPISISISADRVAIAENGGRANITVALSRLLGSTEEAFFVYLDFADGITGIGEDFRLEPPSSPPANVDFVNFDTTDPVGDPPYVSFRSGSTVRSVTFGLVAIDDVVNEGSHENVSIAIGSGSRYKSGITNKFYGGWEAEAGEGRVQLRITDDDIGGVTVTETEGGTFVSEDGMDTDSYDVVLISVPTDNVTVTVIPGDTAAATVNPASLTFTPGNWNEPQTVTVRGVDDVVAQAADRSVVISHTATSTDPVYEGIMIDPVTVTVTDDDGFAGVTITELGGNTEMAEGDSDSYDVVLMALPDGDVTITTEVRNRDPNTEGDVITLSPASLTFTPGNWNQPQTVTVNAVDDTGFTSRLDAHKATIRHSASGGGYDRVGIRDVEVTVWDRDEFGVRFSETDGATVVSEDNLSDSYTVVLKGWNLDDDNVAVISIVSSDATAVAVEPSVLRFTKDDYNKPQTVTVRGVSDAVDQGNGRRHATLRHSIANYHTSAGRYTQDTKPVLLRDIQVAVLERGYNVPAVSITPVDPVAVEGTAASFALRATPNPASPITVDLQVVEGMGSDFVLPADEGPKQVTIGTNGMATLTVNTVAEATDKPDGMVTVSVLAGDDHSVKSPGLATVRIKDDEATTVTFDPSWGSGVSSSTNQGVTVKEFHENPPPPRTAPDRAPVAKPC